MANEWFRPLVNGAKTMRFPAFAPAVLGLAGELGEAERLALVYTPAATRTAWAAALALDAQLARIALAGREPALARIKMAWWREACGSLPGNGGHPILLSLAELWTAERAALVGLVDGWEQIVAGSGGFAAAAESVAAARVAVFAGVAAATTQVACLPAARCWTLHTLAGHAREAAERRDLLELAAAVELGRLPRSLRPLAVLAGLARRSSRRGGGPLIGDRLSPLVAIRLGILGR